jgi:hypothetical protein
LKKSHIKISFFENQPNTAASFKLQAASEYSRMQIQLQATSCTLQAASEYSRKPKAESKCSFTLQAIQPKA